VITIFPPKLQTLQLLGTRSTIFTLLPPQDFPPTLKTLVVGKLINISERIPFFGAPLPENLEVGSTSQHSFLTASLALSLGSFAWF
jgi:hypothetical protein